MRILVTGGAGFIGSCFIKYIMAKYPDYKVINLDCLTYAGNLENLNAVKNSENYNFIKGDVCNKEDVEKATKNCDTIVHFAAESHVDRSILSPGLFIKTNVQGTLNLLEAAKKEGIQRFIQISTDEVYGSISSGFFKEDSMLHPSSPYSASKASADLLVRAYNEAYGLPVIIARCSNNYGPNQYPEKLIPLFISKLLKNEKVPLYGDGKNIRSWTYVYDSCRAIDIILHKGKCGEIYNIDANEEYTNLEITEKLIHLLKKDRNLIEFVQDRPGHDKRYAMDSGKIRKLGWQPETKFGKGIESTVKWYVESFTKKKNRTLNIFP